MIPPIDGVAADDPDVAIALAEAHERGRVVTMRAHAEACRPDPLVSCVVCGREACEDHLPAAPPRPRWAFQTADELIAAPVPDEIVGGAVWADCLTVLASESGTGKSFVAIDLAGATGDGPSWHGRSVLTGSVVYMPFEADALGLRLRAARMHRGHALSHLHILRPAAPLSPRLTRDGEEASSGERYVADQLEEHCRRLAEQGAPPLRIVIVDTARASMTGSEDSSEHVAAYLRAIRRLMALTPGAGWVLTHHAGWQDGDTARKRERGSSAWRGNCDVTLYLEAAGDMDRAAGEAPLTLRALKVRDGEAPPPLALIRRRVTLDAVDRHGRPATSCVIVADPRTRADVEAERAAKVTAEYHVLDLRTLRTIVERPDMATSQDKLRIVLGIRKVQVGESLTRLVQRGWAVPGARHQPYQATTAGLTALMDHQ